MLTALCLVVAIADGDTLTTRCGERGSYEQVKIRIAEIDAPELGQPFGQRSRQSLAALCHEQLASIKSTGSDRYGRALASVECGGTNVAAHQVSSGMAWLYTRYSSNAALVALQAKAKSSRLGLWHDPEPLAPWDWRAKKKAQQRGHNWSMTSPVQGGETGVTSHGANIAPEE